MHNINPPPPPPPFFFMGVGLNYAFPNSYIQQNQLDSWKHYIHPSVLRHCNENWKDPYSNPRGTWLDLGSQTCFKAPGDLQFEVETLCVSEAVPRVAWL